MGWCASHRFQTAAFDPEPCSPGRGSANRLGRRDALELAVTDRDYIAGDRFTAADVYVGAQIGWGLRFGTIEKRPAFERYWERIGQRPAALRANEIDDALMAE
jgi:glutathione S-transferase